MVPEPPRRALYFQKCIINVKRKALARNVGTLYDMHCHLGFAKNVASIGTVAEQARIGALSCTVTPDEFARLGIDGNSNAGPIAWALGLHPWYVAKDWRAQVDAFEELLPCAAAFGELGLDFSAQHRSTADAQVAAFEWLLSAIVTEANRRAAPPLLSLHAVGSAGTVLELLRKTGALDACSVAFHWFSGSGEELAAARAAGCYFSVGPHMLTSRRGRAYGAQIPAKQLLLETDEPPEGAIVDAATWRGQLDGALDQLARLRKADTDQLAAIISATSLHLLRPDGSICQ